MNKSIVYLSGGLRSGWQDKVQELVPELLYIDPRTHGLEDDPIAYTMWDLLGIDSCHVVFAYMEETNPSGIGLALEIGYAKARGKVIILVNEKSDRRFAIVCHSSTIYTDSFERGIRLLKSLIGLSPGEFIQWDEYEATKVEIMLDRLGTLITACELLRDGKRLNSEEREAWSGLIKEIFPTYLNLVMNIIKKGA